jgi:AcrR family transcriptional regulator
MSPDDRRRAIVAAVRPLLLEHGDGVSTRLIAEAAGIAEGTIFRVFPDKDALMQAVAADTLDPPDAREVLQASVAGIDDLATKVRIVTEAMLARSDQVMAVMLALRKHWVAHHEDQPGERAGTAVQAAPPECVVDAHQALLERLTEVFEPHRAELAVPPERAALLLRTLVLGSRHLGARREDRLDADDIAGVLLDGIRRRDGVEA